MVEIEAEDYTEILNWFTHKYGMKLDPKEIDDKAIRLFWKLTFLAEDKIKELKEEAGRKDEHD